MTDTIATTGPFTRSTPLRWVGVVVAATLLPSLGGCTNENKAAQTGGAAAGVPVVVARVLKKSVPVELHAIGRVEPIETVAVKARIGGEIKSVGFEEGKEVQKDQVLFVIDREPLQAVVNQAKANLDRDQVNYENAEADVTRYQKLRDTAIMSEEDFERAQAKAKSLAATLKADRAAVESATILLNFCTIHAPLAGRTGDLLVHRGNVVKADDATPLVVIHQIAPIYVEFSVPEQELPRIRKYHDKAEQAHQKLKVQVLLPGDGQGFEGELAFVDNTVDQTTGTINLKATFKNVDRRLWPGQFVDVTLRMTEVSGAVVVPNEAVQTGQKGPYVFVIKADGTAESRPVVKGLQVGDETVIEKGLSPGEQVVTDGQMRLAPGSKVEVKKPAPTQKGGAA